MQGMATLVFLHAHPDDEAIMTAGSMARAADDGHRVVAVFATRGELGETPRACSPTARPSRNVARTKPIVPGSCSAPGASSSCRSTTPAWPGPTPSTRRALRRGRRGHGGRDLAAILREEAADVLTVYDERGGYEHPDHIQVHHVGRRAAELVGTLRVYAATVDADALRETVEVQRAEALALGQAMPDLPDPDELNLGIPGSAHHHPRRRHPVPHPQARGDGGAPEPDQRRGVLPRHARRRVRARTFGIEWYERLDSRPSEPETWLL